MTVLSASAATSSTTTAETPSTDQLRVVGVRRRTVVVSVIALIALATVVATGWLVARARSGATAATTPTSTHGIAGTLRGGPGFVSAAPTPAAAVSDLHVIAHGTRGFIRTVTGPITGPTTTQPATPSNDRTELVHGTRGSLSDATGSPIR